MLCSSASEGKGRRSSMACRRSGSRFALSRIYSSCAASRKSFAVCHLGPFCPWRLDMSLIWRSRRRRNNSRPVHGKRTQLGIERLEERQMLDAALPNAAQFVTALYYDVMHRSPSPTEVAAWAGFLNQGHSRDQVAASFVMSGEYRIDLIRQ